MDIINNSPLPEGLRRLPDQFSLADERSIATGVVEGVRQLISSAWDGSMVLKGSSSSSNNSSNNNSNSNNNNNKISLAVAIQTSTVELDTVAVTYMAQVPVVMNEALGPGMFNSTMFNQDVMRAFTNIKNLTFDGLTTKDYDNIQAAIIKNEDSWKYGPRKIEMYTIQQFCQGIVEFSTLLKQNTGYHFEDTNSTTPPTDDIDAAAAEAAVAATPNDDGDSTSSPKCENCGKEEDSSSKILKDTSLSLHFCNQQCQRGAWTKHKKKYIDMGAQSLIRAIRDGDTVKVELMSKTACILNGRVSFLDETRSDSNTLSKWSPLHECIRSNRPDMMKILLSNKKLKVDQGDGDGEPPVFVAADSGHAGLVSLLLDAGANPNFQSHDGWTPLMMAARSSFYLTVKTLIEHGADLYAGHDMFGRTALDLVKQCGGTRTQEGVSFEEAKANSVKVIAILERYAQLIDSQTNS